MLDYKSPPTNITTIITPDFTVVTTALIKKMHKEMMDLFMQIKNRTGTTPATREGTRTTTTPCANFSAWNSINNLNK